MVKNAQGGVIELAGQRIAERWDDLGFESFLGPRVLLVPAPRSSPLKDKALWPPAIIAEVLSSRGLAAGVIPMLRRTRAVPKSAFATPANRPGAVDHLDSIAVEGSLALPGHSCITVVDDFVTTGATLLASATRVREVFPRTEVRCFGLVRTISGRDAQIQNVMAPCVGQIRYHPRTGRTTRRP